MSGTSKVIRFNWPKYLAAEVLLVGAWVANTAHISPVLSNSLWALGSLGFLWTGTSLVATWWVYDHRHVYTHLAAGLDDLGEWATVHAGFDDATPVLRAILGRPPTAVVELDAPAGPSLRRARRWNQHLSSRSSCADLQFTDASLDTIFVTFAAHEIRDLELQRSIFGELHRALRPGGRLVITEHPPDLRNFAVYGPGTFHFQPLAIWCRRSAELGMLLRSDEAITPFVHRIATSTASSSDWRACCGVCSRSAPAAP
jgi:SAM-dependent methyltransferase